MDNLLYIDEITIDRCIYILSERFKNKKIYTQLGGVLLSINPYQYFTGNDNIYQLDNTDTVHLFRTMDKVYEGMLNGESQTIIVSGESGSGKTETTKQMIQYLNHYNGNDGNNLLEKIEASGLVLEMFGNAATEKNHNSSRFGKFIDTYTESCDVRTRLLVIYEEFREFYKQYYSAKIPNLEEFIEYLRSRDYKIDEKGKNNIYIYGLKIKEDEDGQNEINDGNNI